MLADSVTFAERVQEIPSPDHCKRYTRVVNTVLRYSNVLHLHQHVCHEIGDTMVRTSRFTSLFVTGGRYAFTSIFREKSAAGVPSSAQVQENLDKKGQEGPLK